MEAFLHAAELAHFRPINVSPFATNVLDLVGQQTIRTADGRRVEISRGMADFVIRVEGERPFALVANPPTFPY